MNGIGFTLVKCCRGVTGSTSLPCVDYFFPFRPMDESHAVSRRSIQLP